MDPTTGQGVWTPFTVREGLPDLKLECLYEDGEGYLWIGTHDRGAARFDGERFTSLTQADGLPSEGVFGVIEDGDGALWLKTREALVRYRDGRSEVMRLAATPPRTFLWGSAQAADGTLWFAVEDRPGEPPAVCRWDGKALTLIPVSTEPAHQGQSIEGMAFDRAGRLWLTGSALFVQTAEGPGFTAVEVPGRMALAVLPRPDGSVWVSTIAGLFAYEQETFTRMGDGFAGRGQAVRAMVGDERGGVWLATLDGQVFFSDGERFQPLRALGCPVQALCLDRAGRLWVGSYGHGLWCYDFARFQFFGPEQGLPAGRVHSLAASPDGRLWVGAQAGLGRSDGPAFAALPAAELEGQAIQALAVDAQDQVWIGVEEGRVYQADEAGVRLALDGERPLGCLAAAPDGSLWVGFTRGWRPDSPYLGGLAHGQDGVWQPAAGVPAGANQVEALAVDPAGGLWVGLWNQDQGHGLYRVLDGGGERVALPGWTAARRLKALRVDAAGALWIGTQAGLYRYHAQTLTHWGPAEGLPHAIVTAITQTRDGVLWIGTEGGGVGVYDGQVLQALRVPGEAGYNTVQALQEDAQGRLWIGAQAGLVRYTPQRRPPRVQVTVGEEGQAAPARLERSAADGPLLLRFQGYSPVGYPGQLVYRYRLHGRDPGWQVSRQPQVEYPSLEPGDYRFEVQAVDPELTYSPLAILPVQVDPDPRLAGLQAALKQSSVGGEFVGQSLALRQAQQQLAQAAQAEVTVLILGETGTGKGLAARTVHELSPRQAGPFLQLTCGAFHEQLIESELFGHEKGSFTGAHARQLGRVELAAGGTLFLDEIGDLPLSLQAKLLRLLEERTFERLGGPQTLTAEVRIVAATNRQLERMVADGSFRQDLLYRLKGFPVRLPPLRQRQEDIPALVAHFLTRMAAHLHKPVEGVDSEALARLKHYAWPGNVRELKNVIERAVIVCAGPAVQAADLALGDEDEPPAAGQWLTLLEHERQYLRRVLRQTGGVIKGPQGAAAILGLNSATLRSRLKKLGLTRLEAAAP